MAPQQTLNIPDEEKNEIESNCNNINGCIIEGSTGNVDLINTNNTHIEPVEKSNHFEKLIQDVRDKYSIGGYNRLKGGKHQKNNMGSNVSRHSGKGLSGRRTQSSGEQIFYHRKTCSVMKIVVRYKLVNGVYRITVILLIIVNRWVVKVLWSSVIPNNVDACLDLLNIAAHSQINL